jgi:hypothetical protein
VFSIFQAGEKFERARAQAEGREPRLYHVVFSSHPMSGTSERCRPRRARPTSTDAPPGGWLVRHDEYLTHHQRHRVWLEQRRKGIVR